MRPAARLRNFCPYPVLILCLLLFAWAERTRAEQLPVTRYTTGDGVAHDHIEAVVRDSRGFLWLCTADGLSRFDGSSFTTYGTKDGLPTAYVNNMMESRGGVYWIATNGGLARFNPYATPEAVPVSRSDAVQTGGISNLRKLFVSYRVSDDPISNRINTLYEDRGGQVWLGTDGGLFRLIAEGESVRFERFELEPEPELNRMIEIWQLI